MIGQRVHEGMHLLVLVPSTIWMAPTPESLPLKPDRQLAAMSGAHRQPMPTWQPAYEQPRLSTARQIVTPPEDIL